MESTTLGTRSAHARRTRARRDGAEIAERTSHARAEREARFDANGRVRRQEADTGGQRWLGANAGPTLSLVHEHASATLLPRVPVPTPRTLEWDDEPPPPAIPRSRLNIAPSYFETMVTDYPEQTLVWDDPVTRARAEREAK